MGKSAKSARATLTRWRCPPESRDPSGPTSVRRPSGSWASQSPSPTRPSTASSSASSASRRPMRRFSARVVSKRWACCSTSPTERADVVAGQTLQADAVKGRLTGIGRHEAHQHVGQGRLAGAAGADERDPTCRGAGRGPRRAARPARTRVRRPDVRGGSACRSPASGKVAVGSARRIARHPGGIEGSEHPARRHPAALERLGGRGQRGDELEGGQRDQQPRRRAARRRDDRVRWRARRGRARPSWPVRPAQS